jgi:ComF family protein
MITLRTLYRAVAAGLGDLLSPPACAACDARLGRRAVFCVACARAVVPIEPAAVVAYASFGGPVAEALRRLKYEGRPDLAPPLGSLLLRAAAGADLCADVVIPVPLHPRRLAERGYNQAALLATEAADALEAPLDTRSLERTRDTPQQARLDRRARLANVAGAFRARGDRLRGRRVVLVDDVATTGATLDACTAALAGVGAASVTALVVARSG